jgi:hypothetical protein
MLELIPPQIQVGTYSHTLQIAIHEHGDRIEIRLVRSDAEYPLAGASFDPDQEDQILPWIQERARELGVELDRAHKFRLRRAGYAV